MLCSLLLASHRLALVLSPSHSADEQHYTVHVSYEDIYKVLVFFIAVFVAGICAKSLGMPSLVGEIVVGFLVSVVIILF